MKSFKAPDLHQVLLMGDDPRLLAELSALIAKKGYYLPVLDGPRIGRPDAMAEISRRNNAVARTKPKKIVLAGLPDSTVEMFGTRFPKSMVLRVNDATQVSPLNLNSPIKTGEPLIWGKNNIGIGLLKALRQKSPIKFTDEMIDERFIHSDQGHLVVCENGNDLTQVIAANYAFALNAGLLLIQEVQKDEATSICEAFYSVYEQRGISFTEVLNELYTRLRQLTGEIPLQNITGITFISKEIPWGFAYPEVPTTHLFSYPDLGIAIINAMASEQKSSEPMRVAVVVDPAKVPTTEVENVAKSLACRGMFVRGFRGPSANVGDVSRMMELFPYDFMLIATHCGDSGGWRETYEFEDSSGKLRELVLDTALSVDSTSGSEKLDVTFFHKFVSLDGVDWEDKSALEKLPVGTAMNDFYSIDPTERNAKQRVPIDRVSSSAALAMSDGNFIPLPKAVAANSTPIILNNACTSWHRLAGTFMFSNARAYIGTLIPVVGVEAEEVAYKMTDKYFGKQLSIALWHAQNEVYGSSIRRPYIMVGVHYQRLTSTYKDITKYLADRLLKSMRSWVEQLEKSSGESDDSVSRITAKLDYLEFELKSLSTHRKKHIKSRIKPALEKW